MRVGRYELVHSWWAFRRAQWLWVPRFERIDPRVVAHGLSVELWCFQWLIYDVEDL